EENRVPEEKQFLSYLDTYCKHLEGDHAVDLSCIIREANEQIKQANTGITGRYKCLAIDEFQDINPVQYEFVRLISEGKQIFAIGDPDQSVYGFRGSDVRLFYRAKDDLKATEVFLKKNYRTPENILDAATLMISHNGQRAKAVPEAVKTSDVPVRQFVACDSGQEAAYIADQVLNYVGGVDSMSTGQARSDYSYAFSDIAILYRTHSVAAGISRLLKLKGIPVLLSDGTSFFAEPPFDVIAFSLQLLQNSNNAIALSGIMEKLLKLNNEQKHLLLKKIIGKEVDPENFSQHESWKKWMTLYKRLSAGFEEKGLMEVMQQLLDFFLPESALTDQQQVKREMLVKLAAEFDGGPADFLQKYVLSPYTDAGRLNSGGVRLMTFHAAKGLEFPVVFIAGAEEGITPLDRKDTDLEEERRLFYVAMTRAKDELQIVSSEKRTVYGQEKEMSFSRFLNEFDPEYLQRVDFDTVKKAKPAEQQLKLF
ncbi:MAG: ATP-dependent helicase, partial [Bacteroidales bacterium]